MYKTVFYLFASLLLLSSCGTSKNIEQQENDNWIQRVELRVKKQYVVKNEMDTTFIHIEYPEVISNPILSRTVDSLFVSHINQQGYNATNYSLNWGNDSVSSRFIQDFLDEYELYFSDDEYATPWFFENTVSFNLADTLLNLSFFTGTYTGGAHPNSQIAQFVIHQKSGKVYRLEELFPSILSRLDEARRAFLIQNGFEETDDLEEQGFWFENNSFYFPPNFVIEDGLIKFTFNQYEVAPYAAGILYFEIPLNK